MKNLIKFTYQYDFGHDLYIQIIKIRQRHLLQISFLWSETPSSPYIQITSGMNGLFGALFQAYKFGFDVDVLSYTWKLDYLDKVKEHEQIFEEP